MSIFRNMWTCTQTIHMPPGINKSILSYYSEPLTTVTVTTVLIQLGKFVVEDSNRSFLG